MLVSNVSNSEGRRNEYHKSFQVKKKVINLSNVQKREDLVVVINPVSCQSLINYVQISSLSLRRWLFQMW